MGLLSKIIPLLVSAAPCLASAGVSLSDEGAVFRMSNDRLAVVIEKSSAKIVSVTLGERNLLEGGSGYWSMSASSSGNRVSSFGVSGKQFVTIDPATNDGARAEVACQFHGTGADDAFPGTAEVRYSLGKDSTVLHAAAVLSHDAGDAAFRLGEARFLLKLDPEIFDHLSIDKNRDRDMPTGSDWDQGTELNISEARRLTTGKFAGSVEHKYDYSAILADLPAYGWCGSRKNFGAWMINPSGEYLAGGPTKMELTGHLDVGNGGRPTLLNMWHGSHYGGTALSLLRDEKWTKVIGPFALCFNQGGPPSKLWYEAVQQAVKENRAWPYAWFKHEAYPPAAERGGVSGKIQIVSTSPDDKPLHAIRVGLTVPDYVASARRGPPETVGWQRDGRNYQYWARGSADGSFKITGVRPGTYVLRAFADGILGEFARKDVTVKAGETLDLSEIPWTPDRAGPTLWQIGIADRSAAEFRNGDHFWQWGIYLKYRTDFPDGVDYTVGKSDWKKDWNLCQPLDLSADGEVRGSSVWTIRFPLEAVPGNGTRLRISFCGTRLGSSLGVDLNGKPLGSPIDLPENGVMHRDSCRGMWFERVLAVPAVALKTGENVLQFKLSGSVWHQGVLYDCVRMEKVEP